MSAALDTLPAATLGQLEAEAALLVRTDRKYVLPAGAVGDLLTGLRDLDPGLRVLDIAGRRRHRYASTYLDTPALDAYWRSARRRRHRFKVRTRCYLDSGTSYTEVKTRGPRGTTVKTRVPRTTDPGDACPDLLHDRDARFVHAELGSAGLGAIDVSSLVPSLRTSYERTTLWLPSRHARVTVDLDLSWSLPWTDTVTRVPGLAVVETKTAQARTGVDRFLWARGHRPVRISKYGTGMALLLDGLPAHRWHRVIERRLRPHLDHDHLLQEAR